MRGEEVGDIGPEALQALHSCVDAYLALVLGYEICWVGMLQYWLHWSGYCKGRRRTTKSGQRRCRRCTPASMYSWQTGRRSWE